MAASGQHQTAGFSWITDPHRELTVRVRLEAGDMAVHDPGFHARLGADPRVFCAPVAVADEIVETSLGVVELSMRSAPYCTRQQHGRMLGWNFVVSVDDGSQVVVAHRSPALRGGGLWHLSCNEGAEPRDISADGDRGDDAELRELAVGKIAARAVLEELGVCWDEHELGTATRTVAVFAVGDEVGVLFHVRGEELGWSGEMIRTQHASAQDGWEGTPHICEFSPAALEELGGADAWTSWSLPVLQHLAALR